MRTDLFGYNTDFDRRYRCNHEIYDAALPIYPVPLRWTYAENARKSVRRKSNTRFHSWGGRNGKFFWEKQSTFTSSKGGRQNLCSYESAYVCDHQCCYHRFDLWRRRSGRYRGSFTGAGCCSLQLYEPDPCWTYKTCKSHRYGYKKFCLCVKNWKRV